MTKYIAHRGYALKKTENTFDAFRFSAGTNCFGIETDVHVTKDGEFVVFHDDSTLRLCGEEYIIEQTSLETLRGLRINKEFQIPTLAEYIEICKSGKKESVIELKNPMSKEVIAKLVKEIQAQEYLDSTTFISFDMNNCVTLRDMLPNQAIQFITNTFDEKVLKQIAQKHIDLDIEYTCLSEERIKYCKSLGLKVNCWTLNDEKIATRFENFGIDYITSNNLGGFDK